MCFLQGKDFERTSLNHLLIKVENDEPLFGCKEDFSGKLDTLPIPHVVNITMKVIDVNDPPYYEKTKEDVYQTEEEPPGKVLFTPKVKDDDSDVSKIRLVSTYCMLSHCHIVNSSLTHAVFLLLIWTWTCTCLVFGPVLSRYMSTFSQLHKFIQ